MIQRKKISGQKNLIREYDVEKYDIVLPFRNLFGRRRKNFLCSELEKRHPCFSDEFTFDVKIRGLKKSGVFTDVFVIHKRKLAEYEGKLGWAGTGFFIENIRRGGSSGSRLFVSRRIKTLVCGAACALAILSIVSVIFVIAGCATNAEGDVMEVKLSPEAKSLCETKIEAPASVDSSIGKRFFEVLGSEGREHRDNHSGEHHAPCISSFEWRIDGFQECLSAELENVFPEMLDELEKSVLRRESVSYVKGLPYMKVEYSRKLMFEGGSSGIGTVQSREAADGKVSRAVREIIEADDAVLLSETFSPYAIDFQIPKLTSESSGRLFENLRNLFCEYGMAVSCLSIRSDDGQRTKVKLGIDENLPEGLDISLLDGKQIYFKKYVPRIKSSEKPPVQIAAPPSDLKKIGEIKKGDGLSTVFYKNSAGKIIRKMEAL